MKVKSIAIVLVFMIIVTLSVGCGSSNTTNKQPTGESTVQSTSIQQSTQQSTQPADLLAPFTKYPEPVTVTIGRPDVQNPSLPQGDTMQDNPYTRFYQKNYNIIVNYAWLADPNANNYNTKVNLAIASDNIPDIMYVEDVSQLDDLIDGGMIEDLTPYFDKTLSPGAKAYYDSYGDQAYNTVTANGKKWAIPDTSIGYQMAITWIRKDWMDKLGLSAPKTLDDCINIAKAFMEEDPGGNGPGNTIGIVGNPNVAGVYNATECFDPVFSTYNSYPRQWIKDASGNVTYGTIAPETKTALAKLAEMYKDGLIDKQFGIRKTQDTDALLASGKCGFVWSPWWMPVGAFENTLKNDPKADWQPYFAPISKDGKFHTYSQNPHTQYVVVKKGFKHPEAIFKMVSASRDLTSANPFASEIESYEKDQGINWEVNPAAVQLEWEDNALRLGKDLPPAVKSKDPSNLTVEEKYTYNDVVKYDPANPAKDTNLWALYTAFVTALSCESDVNMYSIQQCVFPPETKTMQTKWANLKKLEDETLLKIIMGDASVNSFDTFVQQWKQQGGDEITKEVQDFANRK